MAESKIQIQSRGKVILAVLVCAGSAQSARTTLEATIGDGREHPQLSRFALAMGPFVADGAGWWIARKI